MVSHERYKCAEIDIQVVEADLKAAEIFTYGEKISRRIGIFLFNPTYCSEKF